VMFPVPMFPRNSYWNALQCRCCDKSDDVHNADHYCDIYDASEVLMRENAEVEEQDCYLRQCDRRQVKQLSIVEDLKSHNH
jgi:hypothetical protein